MASSGSDHDRLDGARLRGAALHNAAATAIGSWIDELAGRFVAAGLADAEARGLATSLIAILEGAHVLARATGGVDSFDETARMFTALVEHRFGS
jgi:hypothetical protein